MKKLVFATNNAHKLQEVRQIIGNRFELLSLQEIGCSADIPETADTLVGNALLKAQYIKEHFGYDCFADDTGLEIEALNGAPGVYSARYAGEDCVAENNMHKVLTQMEGKENRKACFKTVIVLIYEGENYTFEGRVDGRILTERRGGNGFGYDPIFEPEGYTETFAEMDDNRKNEISHRGRAVKKLMQFLCEK